VNKTPAKRSATARGGTKGHAGTAPPGPSAATPGSSGARSSPSAADPAASPQDTMNPTKVAAKSDPKLADAWKTRAGRDLTEEELLAMPEEEYMNDKQLEFFRARLQALKDDLLSNADETTEHLREDTTVVPDPADRATIEEEHALELRTRDRERKLLKKISQSLTRIENGEYGYCDETGEPIGLARLLARPTATLSLEAQQRRELKQKMYGD
jgi:DnaK suppressor protein